MAIDRLLTNRNRGSAMAELPVAMFILLFFAFFPLINVMAIVTAGMVTLLVAHQTCTRAAAQTRFDYALDAFGQEAVSMKASPLVTFLRMQPVYGFNGAGADLYVQKTETTSSNKIELLGPNIALVPPIDSSKNVYEFVSQVTYSVPPVFNMSGVPFINQVPGLGRPCHLTFASNKMVEHPEGLTSVGASSGMTFSGGSLASLNLRDPDLQIDGTVTNPASSTWLRPNIYSEIENSGKSVIEEAVVVIKAAVDDWQPVNVNVGGGDSVYVDYWRNRSWSFAPSIITDEEGVNSNDPGPGAMACAVDDNVWCMDANMFLTGTPLDSSWPRGELFLMMCEGNQMGGFGSKPFNPALYTDNSGYLAVRVIVAR